jgi:hypothetical protein
MPSAVSSLFGIDAYHRVAILGLCLMTYSYSSSPYVGPCIETYIAYGYNSPRLSTDQQVYMSLWRNEIVYGKTAQLFPA